MAARSHRVCFFSFAVALVLMGCTNSGFSGATAKKNEIPPVAPAPTEVPVDGQKPLTADGLPPKSCESADPNIATVDAATCTVTGVKVGTTVIKETMPDGTVKTTTVQVTPKDAVTVQVDEQKAVPGVAPVGTDGVKSCVSVDPATAKIDPKTCQLTGVKVGTTDLTVTKDDGTLKKVAVTVTPADIGSDDSGATATATDGQIDTSTETKTIKGRVCLGGPACNVSYLMKTEAEATLCMQTANAQGCDNDDKCGQADMLQVCNCECTSDTDLPFDAASGCRRSNPLQPRARARLTVCHKI